MKHLMNTETLCTLLMNIETPTTKPLKPYEHWTPKPYEHWNLMNTETPTTETPYEHWNLMYTAYEHWNTVWNRKTFWNTETPTTETLWTPKHTPHLMYLILWFRWWNQFWDPCNPWMTISFMIHLESATPFGFHCGTASTSLLDTCDSFLNLFGFSCLCLATSLVTYSFL